MRKTSFIVLLLLLAGCGSSLDKSYSNFTAYYNTFYNAKEDFKAGRATVHKQPLNIDPDQPVMPHPIPPSAGVQDFENAVDNAAQILRRFPDSKWTDDALLLMGKSYYYLREYFLARQKFDELLTLARNSSLKQEAVIWKARTLLAINDYLGGIQFLEDALEDSTEKWMIPKRAEARVLLAEHHAMLSHWDQVAAILEPANLHLEDRSLRGRSYFLLGQAFDRTDQLNLAFQAYSNVARNFPNYEYIYHAEVKRASVANKLGNGELAVSIYQKMLNDDKYYDRHNEISYQLAQVYEAAKDFTEARRLYLKILNNSAGMSGQVRSNTYYKLGQLYSREFQDYELAAAYFDSSSIQTERQPAEADRLASAYNRYISLHEQISRIDSLLALGALNDNELEIKLVEVRQQRQEMIKQSGNQIQQTNNILSNVEGETIYNEEEPPSESSGYGFLNYRNSQLIQRERKQFRAVWGDRPLVDNWRRAATVSAQDISEQDSREDNSASIPNQQLVENDNQLGIDVNEIPRSPETRRQLTEKGLKAQYQLGSLLFLTLQEADSAAYYYHRILQDSTANDLRVQTLYSLYELHNLQEQPDSMVKYKTMILESYPETLYADRIRDNQKEGELGGFTKQDSLLILRNKVQELLTQRDNQPSDERANQLVELARENQSSPLAPKILYESIREYILYARYQDKAITDSATTAVSDSVNTIEYSGPYWNRVRMLINEFLERYPEVSPAEQVKIWDDMLKNSPSVGSTTTCSELGIVPAIKPSKEAFLDTITLPERLQGMNVSGSIRYKVSIEGDGSVRSYELLSKSTNLGIEEVYNKAIGQSLQFEPIRKNGNPVRVTCEVIFPIRQ